MVNPIYYIVNELSLEEVLLFNCFVSWLWCASLTIQADRTLAEGQNITYGNGASVSISANGSNNAMVWEVDNTNNDSGGPAILRAYDASNISNQLYDSTQAGSRGTAGQSLKFTVPTITGGKVFIGTLSEEIYCLLGSERTGD